VFAVVCVAVSVGVHLRAGGAAPPPLVIAGCTAAVAALAWPLAGRRRGVPGVAAAMVAVQTALHAAFALSAAPAPGTSAFGRFLCTYHRRPSAALARRALALHPAVVSPAPARAFPALTGSCLLMIGSHLAVAVVAAWWLRRVDTAVGLACDLMAVLRTAARRLLRPAFAMAFPRADAVTAGEPGYPRAGGQAGLAPFAASRFCVTVMVRRGPPGVLAG
jgi:hypothetical protein